MYMKSRPSLKIFQLFAPKIVLRHGSLPQGMLLWKAMVDHSFAYKNHEYNFLRSILEIFNQNLFFGPNIGGKYLDLI